MMWLNSKYIQYVSFEILLYLWRINLFLKLNNGKVEEIATPNSQYYLVVESKAFASIDPHSGLFIFENNFKLIFKLIC